MTEMTSVHNLPVPGFVAAGAWGNRWNIGTNQDVETYFDEAGRLRLVKSEKFTLHTVLNAYPEDFDRIQDGRGVPLDNAKAYTVSLATRNDRGVSSELVLHEFDSESTRVSRLSLSNGERAVFVPVASNGRLVVSLRISGQGGATIDSIEFNPAPESKVGEPGLHSVAKLNRTPRAKKSAPADDLASLMPIRRALYEGSPLSVLLTRSEAQTLTRRFMTNGHSLEAMAVVRAFNLYKDISTGLLRKLIWHGRRSGYLVHALACLDEIVHRTNSEKDREVANRVRREYEFHLDPWVLMPTLRTSSAYNAEGPVLHVVGKALPEKQTGFTVRTKYTVEALLAAGVTSVVAVQAGGNFDEGLSENVEHQVGGVRTVLLAGPTKNAAPRDVWLAANARGLYDLTQEVQPSVIHAHSDFTNGALATHVGEAVGVPVVYESRGFWEETWISRIAKAQGWENLDHILRMYGAPELYELRRQSERRVRERADRVVTLAETMREFILAESDPEDLAPESVYLARNAVDPEDFPTSNKCPETRQFLGIDADAVVVGYISSIVEYEGIDTLIEAYALLKKKDPKCRLLIVGGGPYLNTLKQQAQRLGMDDVIFTGRVPHEEILSYYHAIDLFVVPRRNTRVTELVTPLKPFEAFSTGIPVIVSDVAALAEIAKDSHGAARAFPAGDAGALAEILEQLANDPRERAIMGSRGAEWVRKERSWASNVPTYREVYQELRK